MDAFVLAFGRGELKEVALYLLISWLAATVAASWLSERKGYGERPGLAAGLFLSVIGVVLWLLWPPKRDSKWKVQGAFRNTSGITQAEARAAGDAQGSVSAPGGATERGDPRT
jgi:hypothetical protein